jgi:NAD(P)-dependent dehydrogenase (short-subunit alcohol dehydrogenase family)
MLKATYESWAGKFIGIDALVVLPHFATDTFETNVTALFFVSAAFLPLLSKGSANNHGYSASIVNVASISGMMRGSSSGQYAYASSKAAALHLSKMLGNTLAQAKVRLSSSSSYLY